MGDTRESLKVRKMFPFFLKCKNNYLFKMREKFCGQIAKMMGRDEETWQWVSLSAGFLQWFCDVQYSWRG